MFDLGWSKLIIIALVAIVVVGPKDLPPLLRAIGKFLTQMRRQADEFRAQFNEAMKDTGLDEIRRDVDGIRSTATGAIHDIGRSVEDSTKPLTDAVSDINTTAMNGSAHLNGHAAPTIPVEGIALDAPSAIPAPVAASPVSAAAAAAAAADPAAAPAKGA